MAKTPAKPDAAPAKQPGERRRKGRPAGSGGGAIRESVLAAALALLRTLPPNRVSIAAVARAAEVDPALVRYYFGSREALLLEVAQLLAESDPPEYASEHPVAALEEFIHRTFRFTRSAKYMQRLMVEELSGARSPAVRDQVRAWNRGPIEFYEHLKRDAEGEELADFNPLFLHLAIVGISDFFVSGQALIKLLVPPDSDMAALEHDYERFVVRLLLDGLREREPPR
ncbi:TetR/AcrR family transcriptional regulator [Sphingomonas populi]|uniref:TetR/AcrR family transcriptional regulator n=1 Tax=Sphingomonas populi TaxID=2484750 RepID=A0A4Q6XU10_9SPHN|nr:TetR family transcriptional regulator [Sphingomonas populi]RZF64033.1 TetR/AcrR family transcriptional regulator [Sphingomonas populi]